MNDPTLVADLYTPILCTAARHVLAALPDPVCPRALKFKFPHPLTHADGLKPTLAALTPILLATSSSPSDLHALLVLIHPSLYSIEHACTSGHAPLLDAWRQLAATRRVVQPLTYSSSCVDLASALGHTHVLDWWVRSPFEIKYTHMAVHMAVINARPSVVTWWLAHDGPQVPLKANLQALLMHAIDYDVGAVLHRWLDYGLPADRLDVKTNRDVLHLTLFRKSWTMLDWWVRARDLGIVYPVDVFDPHPHPIVEALQFGIEGVFEWWVGPAKLPLPDGLDVWILDAASAGGLPNVLDWWAAHHGVRHYSAAAMDMASFAASVRWTGRPERFDSWYPSISPERRIAVLDWWKNKAGVQLKYSPDLALAILEQPARMYTWVTDRPSVTELLVPVLQWWVESGLEVDWKTNARPERWDPKIRKWWEREYLKLEEPAAEKKEESDGVEKGESRGYSVSLAFVRMTSLLHR